MPHSVKKVDGITKESTQQMIDKALEAYPEKGKKKRQPHLAPNDPTTGSACVKSNRKTVPGVMSARGCAYAGAKGVVWGPIRDMAHISHGPVGCGWYSWGTRRNLMSGRNGVSQFSMQMTSDFQEKDIVYGGDKKLAVLLREAKELFPLAKGISVLSECPVGLIGDDINAVAKKMTKELDLPVVPCNCEGFRGVSQSLGHHIANDAIRTVIYDDATEHELERFVEAVRPDLVGSGIKEKYVFQKMGVPFRQMHSWDYSGPYHGYEGFPIFARDMDMAINSPTWKLVKDPFAA